MVFHDAKVTIPVKDGIYLELLSASLCIFILIAIKLLASGLQAPSPVHLYDRKKPNLLHNSDNEFHVKLMQITSPSNASGEPPPIQTRPLWGHNSTSSYPQISLCHRTQEGIKQIKAQAADIAGDDLDGQIPSIVGNRTSCQSHAARSDRQTVRQLQLRENLKCHGPLSHLSLGQVNTRLLHQPEIHEHW